MASQPHSTYKSRLLNFVNSKAIDFQDRLGKTIRQVKVAVQWGVQIALYPLYILVQTGRTAVLKFEQNPHKTQLLLSTEESDSHNQIPSREEPEEPIERILKTVKSGLSSKTLSPVTQTQPKNLLTNSPTNILETNRYYSSIRGLANLLETRALVLVTNENQILDILKLEQQEKLEEEIIGAIANYRDDSPLELEPVELEPEKSSQTLPKIAPEKVDTRYSVGLFWEIMDWMESSSLARKIDLFQESDLVSHSSTESNYISSPQEQKFLALTPQTGLVSAASSSPVKEPDPWLTPEELFKLDHPSNSLITKPENNNHLAMAENLIPSTPSFPERIKTLIQAAMDYFTKRKQEEITGSENHGTLPTRESEGNSPQLLPRKKPESWLSWGDLFGETAPPEVKEAIIQPRKSQDWLEETTTEDWLETKATFVGYSQHPLEKILAWLDGLLLFLEELSLSIWRWLKKNRR